MTIEYIVAIAIGCAIGSFIGNLIAERWKNR